MRDLLDRLIQLEQRMARERGLFSLFALFLREDAPDRWDLVVAAPWLTPESGEPLSYIAAQLQKELKPAELTRLSRIAIIEQSNPGLEAIHNAVDVEHGLTEVQNSVFFGLPIKHAYIITSRKLPSGVAEPANA